jgi:hypothetical protein
MSKSIDPFDLERLRVDPDDDEIVRLAKVPTKIQKRQRRFVQVPMLWVEKLNGASGQTHQVALHIWFLNWKGGGKPIKLANAMLRADGVPRETKRRALLELEQRGLITVDSRTGKSPLIRVLALA